MHICLNTSPVLHLIVLMSSEPLRKTVFKDPHSISKWRH